MGIRESLAKIDPSKKCLSFLAERILDVNYRGIQLSQHNRYDVIFITTMLTEMYNLVGRNRMFIRTTDLSKRPYNYPEEKIYAQYVNNLCAKLERCTQDSVRKNFFVDLHRMGFIYRYNEHGYKIGPYERSRIKSVSLTPLGIELVNNSPDIFQRNLIYTKAIDTLTNGLADELLDVVSINDKLTMTEFQFFMSFIDQKLNGHLYTKSELIDFVLEFRSMSGFQRQAVVDVVAAYCDPKKFGGNKLNKRDFHNWKNETQQIFMLLDQTVLFELRQEKLVIRLGETSLFDDDTKLKRSLKEKEEYFKNHEVKKQPGFELHHVIPLLTAKSKNEFAVLDVWENMVYIDGYTHSKITHTNNKNTNLSFMNDDIVLKDPAGVVGEIDCEKDTNVIYNTKNKIVMKEFNEQALNVIG